MMRKIHVIAAFNPDGEIRPLWIRLSLDPAAPIYKVLYCKCVSQPNQLYNYAAFVCTVAHKSDQHEVKLHYHATKNTWSLVINNSAQLIHG